MKIKLDRTTAQMATYQVASRIDDAQSLSTPDLEEAAESLVSDERRSFLGVLSGLIGAGISVMLGITLARFSVVPALSASSASEWLEVGPLPEVLDGKPANLPVLVSQNAGWGRFTSEQSVWAVKKDQQLTVYSSVCPHLGCTINENPGGFGCVCHDSAWNLEGEKLRGPAPRAMDVLDHKVENGLLKVRYQNFKQGVSEKQIVS
jgi:menaquinol-cytochrome c reductase iron-sulfur subunit